MPANILDPEPDRLSGTTVILPIAFDLARREDGTIECGPGTRAALDQAICYACKSPRPLILLTATEASAQWDSINMGLLMQEYVIRKDWRAVTAYEQAEMFNTLGELLALTAFLQRELSRKRVIREVLICVKDWHAERVRAIQRTLFRMATLSIPATVLPHGGVPASRRVRWLEPIKTMRDVSRARAWQAYLHIPI